MTELRYNKDGVPIYDGAPELFVAYQRAALTYAETIEWKKRSLVGPRLQAALEGSATRCRAHAARLDLARQRCFTAFGVSEKTSAGPNAGGGRTNHVSILLWD